MKIGPNLPFARFGHCILKIDVSLIYIIGGHNKLLDYQSDIFIFNSEMNQWNLIQSGETPCKPLEPQFQTNCALHVGFYIIIK